MGRWLRRSLGAQRQAIFSLVGAAALSVACWLPSAPFAEPGLFAYLAVASTGAITANALYLNIITLGMARQVRDWPSVTLVPVSPSTTPGFRALVRAIQTQARAGLLLLALVMLPLTFAFVSSKSDAQYGTLLTLTLLGSGSVLAVGVTAQLWVTEPVQRERQRLGAEAASRLQNAYADALRPRGSNVAIDRARLQRDLLRDLESDASAALPVGTLLRYALAIAPGLVQVAVIVIKASS